MTVFTDIAPYYDLLYDEKDYDQETAFVIGQIREVAPEAASVLDLGCGTGSHALRLAAAGFDVVGVDRSTSMLARARSRQEALEKALGARVRFAEHDVRSVDLGRQFDAVVSLFHVLSYQITDEDQSRAFSAMRRHVRPGGAVLFDFWHGPAVVAQEAQTRVKRVETEAVRVTRIAEPVARPESNQVDVNYTFFVEDRRSGGIQELRETHRMRYLFPDEIEVSLEQAGLRPVRCAEWLGLDAPGASSWSAFILATTR